MKKIFFALMLVALAGALYFYLQSPPKFEGKYAAVHEGIWKFSREKSPKEKLEIATRLQMSAVLRQEDPGLSDEEKKIEAEANQFLNDTTRRVKELESKLTAEDVASITQSNPDSFFRRAKMFSTTGNYYQNCSPEQYLAIRQKIGFPDMAAKATYVGPLVTLYEDEHRPSYYERLVELIRADGRFQEYRDLADGYYALAMDPPLKMPAEERESRKAEYEGKLAAAGLSPEQIPEYVLDLAVSYPSCLGGINIDFVRQVHDEEAQTRAAENTKRD
jgi:hypothetical protein